jgi:hypothetical protein
VFNISYNVYNYQQLNRNLQTIRDIIIKYCFDYKESKHLKEAQLKELVKEMSLLLEELEVEA